MPSLRYLYFLHLIYNLLETGYNEIDNIISKLEKLEIIGENPISCYILEKEQINNKILLQLLENLDYIKEQNNTILQKLQSRKQVDDRFLELENKLESISGQFIQLKKIIKEGQKEVLELLEKVKTIFT